MAKWTTKWAVINDLSEAQGGRKVPVDLHCTPAGDKPSTQNIIEETEEEFFCCHTVPGELAAPDLHLIKEMLDMVCDSNESDDETQDTLKNIQISKLNIDNSEYVVPALGNQTMTNNNMKKKRLRRNVAMESLLKTIESENETYINTEPVKLLKPSDFTSDEKETELKLESESKANISQESVGNNITKVNGLLNQQSRMQIDSQSKKLSPELNIKIMMKPSSMFKKKLSSLELKQSPQTVTNLKTREQVKSQINKVYKPSKFAEEYYNKCVEKIKLQEQMNDNIWSRAERQMKEIDAKRKLENANTILTSNRSDMQISSSTQADSSAMDLVRLPSHRHLLSPSSKENCVVCAVFGNYE